MGILARGLVVLVALLHIGFLVLEMFLWTGPIGQRVFAMTPEFAEQSAVLAANQGFYNGLIAAGLLWGALRHNREFMIFFTLCVVAAGVYGEDEHSLHAGSARTGRVARCAGGAAEGRLRVQTSRTFDAADARAYVAAVLGE
jgi:putative membrane protein